MEMRIEPAGDAAWVIELPDRVDAGVNEAAIDLANRIEAERLPAVTDVVVGFRTITVYANPFAVERREIEAALQRLMKDPSSSRVVHEAHLTVPVCYGGVNGPDLAEVAEASGCSEDEVVRLHLGTEYRVFVVGFLPGFAYMASLDSRLAVMRRETPRLRVPAGSVAIAFGQTGVYPSESPGGWHIIGRTPVKPYDPARSAPFLFAPGDRVRFTRITEHEFQAANPWSA